MEKYVLIKDAGVTIIHKVDLRCSKYIKELEQKFNKVKTVIYD